VPPTPTPEPTSTPTPDDDRWECGSGETSAGRSFTILCGGSEYSLSNWVRVEGENEVFIGTDEVCAPIRRIEVDEYAGTPSLLHIKWRRDDSCHGPSRYGYCAFAQGSADTVLLRGEAQASGPWDPTFSSIFSGRYDFEYADAVLSITEFQLTGHGQSDADGYCRATEVNLGRRYAIDSSGSTPLVCAKASRTASFYSDVRVDCFPRVKDLLQQAPWQPVDMDPEETEQRCRAIWGGF